MSKPLEEVTESPVNPDDIPDDPSRRDLFTVGVSLISAALLAGCGSDPAAQGLAAFMARLDEERKKKDQYNAAKERSVGQVPEHNLNAAYMTQFFINPELWDKYGFSFNPDHTVDIDLAPADFPQPPDRRNRIQTAGRMSSWPILATSLYLSSGELEGFYLDFLVFSFERNNTRLSLPEEAQFVQVNSRNERYLDITRPKPVFETIFPVSVNWPSNNVGGTITGTGTENPAIRGSVVQNGTITLAVRNPGNNNLKQFFESSPK